MSSVIEVNNLRKTFASGHEALRGISFSVTKGEIFGLLGPNGAGKTTTLEILEGLKQPNSGEVKIFGLDAIRQSAQVKQKIGVQLQSSEYFPSVTLSELITLFASFYHKQVDTKHILSLVNLQDKAEAEVKNLSGGQKHRFAVASALVNNPQILFLDEPTTGLDPRVRREMWQLIRKLNDEGVTIFITTHYMEEAEYLCDRVAIIDRGQILTIDQPRALINNLAHTSQVSFFAQESIDYDWLTDVVGVEKIYHHDPKVIVEIKTVDAVPKILQALTSKNVHFTGFTLKTATLEDVYLDLTGKELETEHVI
ncbi:MAG TPA: ABC transporter ATP-binding protein [Verrucomicrobiae bacterium]|nr:ABC transporter ATP-binding protein [Verrucomicrobiae bacterium]